MAMEHKTESESDSDFCECEGNGGPCDQCQRGNQSGTDSEVIETFEEFSAPHDRIFKAYIDDMRELVREENGNLPGWWGRVMTFCVDPNELDVEPGEFVVPPANRDLVRIVSWFASVTLLLSFAVEFHQEFVAIRALKQNHPLTLSCIELGTHAQSMTWLERMAYLYSGLEDAQARQCHEQQRIHALLSIPNPFIVLVNLVWRGFMGDNAAVMLTRLLSQQTYVVQASLICATAVVIGLVVYNLILALPALVASMAQSRDTRRREVYDDLQLQQLLRRQTAGEASKEALRAEAVKRKQREKDKKLAVYHAFMRAQKTSQSLAYIAEI